MVRAEAGFARTLVSPAIGLLDAGLEGYLGLRGTAFDAGIRALFQVPYLGLGTGIELDVPNQLFNWIVTARSTLRRGGILCPGGLLRINWYPMESHGFTVGLSLPFGDPRLRHRLERIRTPQTLTESRDANRCSA